MVTFLGNSSFGGALTTSPNCIFSCWGNSTASSFFVLLCFFFLASKYFFLRSRFLLPAGAIFWLSNKRRSSSPCFHFLLDEEL
eukprot:Gb_31691 [translate_table: standard]